MSEQEQRILIAEDMTEAALYPVLGPAYFSSRRIVEQAMSGLSDADMKGVIKTFADEAYSSLLQKIEDYLWSDTECNLQGKMWRMVDEIVKGILTGEKWVVERYALDSRYESGKVREAIARHFPNEIKAGRIADLEAELDEASKSLARLREYVRS